MKSEIELEQGILDILNKIHQEFPELIKYVNEMPISTLRSTCKKITDKELEAYFNSLCEIYSAYYQTHPILNVNTVTKS